MIKNKLNEEKVMFSSKTSENEFFLNSELILEYKKLKKENQYLKKINILNLKEIDILKKELERNIKKQSCNLEKIKKINLNKESDDNNISMNKFEDKNRENSYEFPMEEFHNCCTKVNHHVVISEINQIFIDFKSKLHEENFIVQISIKIKKNNGIFNDLSFETDEEIINSKLIL